MFVSSNGKFPAGMYVCTWEGTAEVRFGGDGRIMQYERGRVTVDVQPMRGLTIWVRSDPHDPVRDMKLWLPGTEGQASPFYPLFVERLRPFGTIRFMNWQLTNNSKIRSWSERPTEMTQNQNGKGVALENMIKLVNELEADAWWCMPAMADDDYVRRFAMMVKEQMHKEGKIYVEYSNEIWNGAFRQHRWVMDQAKDRAEELGTKWEWLDEWSWQMKRVFEIWEQVFKGDEQRLVRVISGQEVNPWIAGQLCEKVGKGNFDALSTSAYFGNKHVGGNLPTVPEWQDMGLAKKMIVEGLEVLRRDRLPARNKHGEIAKQYGVPYVIYEGGQHFTPGGETATSVVGTAQVLPEMYEAYLENMKIMQEAGAVVFIAYDYCEPTTNFGSWGHLAYQNEPFANAPKYRAILDFYGVEYPESAEVMPP